MKPVPKGVWSYAILLVVLFAVASIAVWHTIAFLEERLPAKDYGLAAGLISSISLGFMLIAAAFGLWAIRFSSEAESLRRIGRVVETGGFAPGLHLDENYGPPVHGHKVELAQAGS